jgi:hypothetical protein
MFRRYRHAKRQTEEVQHRGALHSDRMPVGSTETNISQKNKHTLGGQTGRGTEVF